MITTERIRHLFTYDKAIGHLVRNFKRGKALAGTFSSCTDRNGYIVIGVDGKIYKEHRLVWLYVNGEFPDGDLDHINRIKADNKIENLRCVNKCQNRENIDVHKNNKCGVKGVWLHNQSGKWCASIGKNGKNIHLGSFNSIDEAAVAYKKAAEIYHTINSVFQG